MGANPVKIIGHFGVNTWKLWFSTVFTPAYNAPNVIHIVDIRANQGASGVTLTGIDGTIHCT